MLLTVEASLQPTDVVQLNGVFPSSFLPFLLSSLPPFLFSSFFPSSFQLSLNSQADTQFGQFHRLSRLLSPSFEHTEEQHAHVASSVYNSL